MKSAVLRYHICSNTMELVAFKWAKKRTNVCRYCGSAYV